MVFSGAVNWNPLGTIFNIAASTENVVDADLAVHPDIDELLSETVRKYRVYMTKL